MKRIFLFSLLLLSNIFSFAQDKPLIRVGVDSYYPPHVIQAGNNQLFGFDIALITHVCRILNRKCKFYPMPFSDLIANVEQGNLDIAVGAITVTPERAAHVSFSKPYLESKARFLGNNTINPASFTLAALRTYKIGAVQGTIFPQVLASLGVKESQITFYPRLDTLIDALNENDINIAIMDNTSAIHWQRESSGLLVVLGKAFHYGYGIAIVVNRNNPMLLQEINSALDKYLKDKNFKENYDKYLSHLNKV